MKRIIHFISLLLIITLTFLSFYSLLPKKISDLNTEKTSFSTERAMKQLEVIAKEPHFVGTKAHTEVRNYILNELQKLGIEPQVQEGYTFEQWGGYGSLVKPKNILARIRGTGSGKAVLLMSHYDSAPHSSSYGASDAGSGVVAILEGIRAFLAKEIPPVNDIIICFTDSEELGLNGARLFVNEHPWAKDIGIALNFEARGSGGPSNMIVETNNGNSNLIKGFKEADVPYPVATSLMYSIYKMLPNDTDSTVLREDGDIDGFFFAFIDDHFDYHTSNDVIENLDKNSLEHQGSYLMPLLNYYANSDLSKVKSNEDYVYFDAAVVNFMAYPFSWIWPMVFCAFILFITLIIYGLKKERLHIKSIFKGLLIFLVSIFISGGLLYLLWEIIKLIYPSYLNMLPVFLYNGHWYIIAFVMLTLSLVFSLYQKYTTPEDTPNLLVAPLFVWLLINVIVASKLQGAAFFIIPVYFGLLGLFMILNQESPSKILLTFICAPAIFLIAPLIQFFPIGLGPNMLYVSSIFLTLLFGLLIPVFGYYENKKIIGVSTLSLGLLFLVIAHLNSDATPDSQNQNSLIYYYNMDHGKAYWATYDKSMDNWTKSFLGEQPEEASKYIGNAAGSKYNTPYSYAKETDTIDFPETVIQIKKDTVIGNLHYRTINISPKRNVHQLRLYTDRNIDFRHLEYNGIIFKPDSTETLYKKRRSKGILNYFIGEGESLEFTYAVPNGTEPIFTLKEFSYELLNNPYMSVSPRPDTSMPRPFIPNDAIIIERTLSLY
ncbi:M28 family peptidase [Urechidicola vernalis]|uniref:Vacuolar membrane protease n=1 Tax=Urechidicola vernalis TaxID=3075600 RepID=A0ABU2Y4A0_9FLAO|nr:M28 family peptidase [Urechidicola sp. P050]MDT0552991.1 M28 family peptidase [Urechidicola sp. P050]